METLGVEDDGLRARAMELRLVLPASSAAEIRSLAGLPALLGL